MCAMCAGAVVWSGVERVCAAATTGDVEQIAGFDEGPKHPDMAAEYSARGIELCTEVNRPAGVALLESYRDLGGHTYNAARST